MNRATSKPHVEVFVLLLALAGCNVAHPQVAPSFEQCGRVFPAPAFFNTVNVVCPDLATLPLEQIWKLVVFAIDQQPRRFPGDVRVLFFRTEPMSKPMPRFADEERRLEQWDGLLVGHYSTRNGVLLVRVAPDERWAPIRLPPQ